MRPSPDHTPQPLARHRLFHSRDLDEARSFVASKFCDHRLNILSAPNRFRAHHHRAEGRRVSLNFIEYGADVGINPGELGSFYLIQLPIRGVAEVDNGSGAVLTSPGSGSVLNPHRATQMRWFEGCAQLLLQIDAGALKRQVARMTGIMPQTDVTFETALRLKDPQTQSWLKRLRTCVSLAERNALFTPSHSPSQLLAEQELIAGLLTCQPNSYSYHIQTAQRAQVSNLYVRRALHYIHANLAAPMRLHDIADAVGVTSRNLQICFQTELSCSPMTYLRNQRLQLAQHELRTNDGTRSVGDICYGVGFTHFGRFSTAYRERYGESPRETLRSTISDSPKVAP